MMAFLTMLAMVAMVDTLHASFHKSTFMRGFIFLRSYWRIPHSMIPPAVLYPSRGVLITPSRGGGIDQTTLSHSVHHHGQTALTDSLLLWIDRALKRKKLNPVFSRTEFTYKKNYCFLDQS